MASIRKRSGKYQAQIRRLGFDPIAQTFISRTDAVRWARQMESEMDRGIFMPRFNSEQITIGALIDRYQSEITPTKRSIATENQTLPESGVSLAIGSWRRSSQPTSRGSGMLDWQTANLAQR